MRLPGFDFHNFPFVIARMQKSNFVLLNLKARTIETLLECDSRVQGFCIEMGPDAFDFHFTTVQ